jgi:hypothetical protein
VFQDAEKTVILLEKKDGSTLETTMDTKDYPLIAPSRWFANPLSTEGKYYAATMVSQPEGRAIPVTMHQFLTKGKDFDHADRDTLNNRRSNLREATRSQQMYNIGKRKGIQTTSQYLGVFYSKYHKAWMANVKTEGVSWRRAFSSELAAAHARDAVAKEQHGEFAVLNFPEQVAA